MADDEKIERLERRLERERQRREEAERLAEEATRDLYHQAQQLETANEELERLVSVAYHHLQEPVRGVVSHLQRVDREVDDLPEPARESLGHAIEAARRQRRQIQDLIRYAEATGGEPVDPEEVDLEALMSEAIQGADGEETAEIQAVDLPRVPVDPEEFPLVFHHIVEQVERLKGGQPRLQVEAKELPQAWLVEIRDPDVQLDEAELRKVFDLFSRVGPDADEAEIGLAVARTIVRRHGGELTADADDGSAVFQLRLSKRGPDAPSPEADNRPTGKL